MEKKNKSLPILISILVSILGYFIFYSVYQISMAVLGLFPMADNELIAGMILKWGILMIESICMFTLIYHFHKETKGITIGYGEVCLLLWLCGILGLTIISGSRAEASTVLIVNLILGIIKDIRMITAFFMVFAFASVWYTIRSKMKRKEETRVKRIPDCRKQKMIYILLAIPAGLLAYGIYRLIHIVFLGIIVQLFIAPNLWEMNNLFFDILVEILSGYCFVVLLRSFQRKTKGILIGYMEAGFLLWIPLLWKGVYENSKWINTFHGIEREKWLLPIFLLLMIAVSIYYKKKKNEAARKTNMRLPFFLVIFSFGIYYAVILCISIANFFDFQLALIISCSIFSIYFFVLQQLSKEKLIRRLLLAYVVFLSGLLLLCSIYIVQEWKIGSHILSQKDYLGKLIKDMVPNLEMYFAYGISILTGGILSWGCRRQQGGDNEKEK